MIVALSSSAIGYCLYYFLGIKKHLCTTLLDGRLKQAKFSVVCVLVRRFLGVVFLGILPLLAIYLLTEVRLEQTGISLPRGKAYLLWTLLGCSLVILINTLAARTPENLELYPEFRTSSWTLSLLILSSITWIAFLIAYEMMFRGIILLTLERSFGATVAIISSVLLYALAHMYKGSRETAGAVPFGIFISWLTIISHSIIPAIIVHSCTALSNEYLSIYYSRKRQGLNK